MKRLALLTTLLLGCFGSHGNGDDPCDCCGTTVDREEGERCDTTCIPYCSRPPPDGGTTVICDCCGVEVPTDPAVQPCELGVCDPYCLVGPRCPPTPIDLICGYSHITAGVPTTIPVQIGGRDRCYCGETISCSVDSVRGSTIELSTGMCSDDLLCDGCMPFIEGTCDLPSLDEGKYTVNVNGQPAFELDVTPPDVLPERGQVCERSAYRDESCGVLWPPRPYEASLICHPTGAYAGQRVAIEVHEPCADCGSGHGPCQVDVFDDVIRVQPSALSTACDVDCPAICMPREDVCYTPPLEPGVWRVVVGMNTSTLTVSDGDEPPPEGETCGPFMPLD